MIINLLGGSRFIVLAKAIGIGTTDHGRTVIFFHAQAHGRINSVEIWTIGHARYAMNFYRGSTLISIVRDVSADNLPRAFYRTTGIDTRI